MTRRPIKSWGPILATSPSSGTAKPPPPPAKTGSTIYVGAPAGTAQGLAVLLHGKVGPVNECRE